MTSRMNGEHWTTDHFIEYLYGLRLDDGHLASCVACAAKLQELQNSRAAVEAEWTAHDAISFDLLAAQRRRIYAAIQEPRRWWSLAGRPQLASAAVVVTLLAGGATLVEHKYASGPSTPAVPKVANTLSDSQLAEEVSSFADSAEPNAAAPLQQLFED